MGKNNIMKDLTLQDVEFMPCFVCSIPCKRKRKNYGWYNFHRKKNFLTAILIGINL